MGALYQLHSHTNLGLGECIFVNGPYDTFGYVVKAEREIRDGFQLYLIRGTGTVATDWPVHDCIAFSESNQGGAYFRHTSSYDQRFCKECRRPLDDPSRPKITQVAREEAAVP
jgi:hypothetical protein